jgi:hypothetical protein
MKSREKEITGKIPLLAIVFMLLAVVSAYAESPDKGKPIDFRIGASLGYSFTGYRDETDVSLNKYLNTLTYIVDGNIEHGNFFHSLNFGFFTGKIEGMLTNPDTYQQEYTFSRLYLEYALDYRLWGNQTFPGYLGGAVQGFYFWEITDIINNIRSTNITPRSVNFSNVLVSLNIHVSQKWIIDKKNTFVFSVNFPVLGYASRPPYIAYLLRKDEIALWQDEIVAELWQDDRMVSLHNYWAVFGDLKYNHKINSLLSLYSGLDFALSHIDFPMPRKDAQFRLNSGIAFTF